MRDVYCQSCVTRHIMLLFLDDHLKHFFSQSTSAHSASEAFATMRYYYKLMFYLLTYLLTSLYYCLCTGDI